MKKNKLEIGSFSMNQMGRSQMINVKGGGEGSDDPPPIPGDPLTTGGTDGGITPGSSVVTTPPFIPFPSGGTGVINPPKPTKPSNT